MYKIFAITVNGHKGFETYIVRSDNEQNALSDLKKEITWLGYSEPKIEDIQRHLDILKGNILKLEKDWH